MSIDQPGEQRADQPADRPADQPVDLGMALRALRRRRDLSQRRLAELAGVPASSVARIESGENTNPRIRTVERLARAAGGGVWVGAPYRPATPVPHESRTDAAHRHFPAHLDVTVTYPFVGRDRRVLPAGTAVLTYGLERDRRDADRARAAGAAKLSIERFDRPGGGDGWLWVARTGAGELAGRLGAVVLSQAPEVRRAAVLCDLQVAPAWRGSTLEQRLLGCLREELARWGPTELVTLTYGGMETEYLRQLGFHRRSTTVFVLAGRP